MRRMKIGDLIEQIDKDDNRAYASILPDEIGVVIKTDESLSVTSHCVRVAFPSGLKTVRCSYFKVIS